MGVWLFTTLVSLRANVFESFFTLHGSFLENTSMGLLGRLDLYL